MEAVDVHSSSAIGKQRCIAVGRGCTIYTESIVVFIIVSITFFSCFFINVHTALDDKVHTNVIMLLLMISFLYCFHRRSIIEGKMV